MLGSTSKLMIAMIAVGAVACNGGASTNAGNGGAPGAGGAQGTGGMQASGGAQGEGGATGSGGVPGAGGKQGQGGGQGSGGAVGSGGSQGSGGRSGSGGMPGTGGLQGTGGALGTGGGAATGTGGQGRGGAPVDGGVRGTGGSPGTGGSSGAKCPDGWKLAWSDEFEGSAGSAVDSSKWAYDSGPNWYNGELQYYSQGSDNAKLDGTGNLVIEARKESREGRQYTSARLKTEGKKTFTYGRFEGRMKLPYGQGMWPAFWLLGAQGGSWPACGEIDIMENLGKEPSIAHGTMHGTGYSGASGPTATYTLPDGAKFSDDFHVFAIEWEQTAIRWYVDGKLYSTKTQADIGGNTWLFNHPFFFILNLAVGGDWPGAPDGTTVFPQKLIVDYVRVCQQ